MSPKRTPLYRTIQRALENEIVSGSLVIGEQIPTEKELQQKYSVSRITAQKAIQNLERNGLVVRRPGAGTFVSQVALEQNLIQFTNFMSEGRMIPGIHKLLSVDVIVPEDDDSRLLGTSAGEAVYSVKRIKMTDNVPMVIEWSLIPFKLAPDLAKEDLGELHLYGYFKSIGLKVESARMYLTPHALSEEEAQLLRKPEGALTFLWERISHLDSGSTVELTRMILRNAARRFFVEFPTA